MKPCAVNGPKEREQRQASISQRVVVFLTDRSPQDECVGRMEFLLNLRRRGIAEQAVLRAMDEVPREYFVGQEFSDRAYENSALPIACGQTISQPYIVAYMSEALEAAEKHRVLEIGTGCGYKAAVLAKLCRMVYSIERHRPLLKAAEARFKALKLHNVVTRHGDGLKGWPEQ